MKIVLVCFLLCTGLVGCSGDSEPVATNEIMMTSAHAFDPAVVAPESETITFVNDDDEPHTVTAYEDSLPEGADYFSSGEFGSEQAAREDVGEALIPPGEEFTLTLDEPGTYEYFCIPHEDHGMKGQIQI